MTAPQFNSPGLLRRRWLPALIWLVPLMALLIGLTMLVQTYRSAGEEITISFNDAAGLEAGKTVLKYKDVIVGVVETITLNADNSRVLVHVRLSQNAGHLASSGSRFWVVRPRVGLNGVSGIDTLLSGAYIGVDRGTATTRLDQFTGLENPPAVISDTPGRQYVIDADDLGSLDIGSPVYYRRVQVGRVVSFHLREDGKGVSLRVFINAPYDNFVTPDTRFWNVSGVDLSVGTEGFRLKTQTVAAIMAGGVAFATPENNAPTAPNTATHYTLAADEESAMAAPDGPGIQFQLHFERSLRGLAEGAPVEFSSVNIGRVLSIALDYNPTGYRFPTRVTIEVYPSRIGQVLDKLPKLSNDPARATALFTRDLVKNGLRAQAIPSSLLTGQLYISLDFIPDASPVAFDLNARPLQLPTVSGGLDKIQEQLASIVQKVNNMPLAEMGNNLNVTLVELSQTLRMVNQQTLPTANRLMSQAQQTTDRAKDLLAADSPLLVNFLQTLQEANRTLRAMRNLSDQLSRHPDSLLRGNQADVLPDITENSRVKAGVQP